MKNLFFLFFAITVLAFNHSWLPGMFMDGAIYATLGKNAALFNHWLIPHFAPEALNQFAEHPPFLFIFEGLLFKIFGVSWTASRLPGLVFNLGTVWILWRFLSRFRGKEFAYGVVVVLIFCLPYIKKSRFPNMDIALTFFIAGALICYFKAFLEEKRSYWIGCGLFFGLGALMKGHPALFVPMIIIFHLAFSRNLKKLLNWAPWYSFSLGLLIFSLWPLALYFFTGSTEIFQLWFQRQFIDTIFGARSGHYHGPFVYLKILLKFCLPWILLAGLGVKKHFKEPLVQLSLIWFLSILFSMSCFGWKLAHYILPLYPALAILAAFGIESLGKKALDHFGTGANYVLLVIALVLLCFPVSNQIRRSRSIFYAKDIIKTFKEQPTAFALVEEATDFWGFAPAVSFPENINPYRLKRDAILELEQRGRLKQEKGWIFLVRKKVLSELAPLKRLEVVIEYQNTVLLAEKRLLGKALIYPYKK